MLVLENDRQRVTRGGRRGCFRSRDAAAQGAFSILPYFDEIAKQADIET